MPVIHMGRSECLLQPGLVDLSFTNVSRDPFDILGKILGSVGPLTRRWPMAATKAS